MSELVSRSQGENGSFQDRCTHLSTTVRWIVGISAVDVAVKGGRSSIFKYIILQTRRQLLRIMRRHLAIHNTHHARQIQ